MKIFVNSPFEARQPDPSTMGHLIHPDLHLERLDKPQSIPPPK